MFFKHYGVNPTIDTAEEAFSTFGIDVDTASYSLVRSYLERGAMPPDEAVRVEEIVNAFDYGYEPPADAAFSVQAEAFPSPNRKGYHVLHIGLRGMDVSAAARKPANLVFVIDVSGSMAMENRLGLVKKSLRLLVGELGEGDSVGIVAYGTTARVVLEPTSADRKDAILGAIEGLQTEGSTNAEAGLRVGYQMAASHLRPGGVNRLILCTDGVANTGATSAAQILAAVKEQADRGITIATVGFGMGNYNDVLLEQLADKGNGNYHYVDKLDEARRVFVENLTGTLQVIAKDVKIQVEFDPRSVQRYRLLGYENRGLEKRDFDNDRVDAGEIGAGHAVTALYEVKLASEAGSLGKLRIRFKPPEGSESQLILRELSHDIVRGSLADITAPARLSLVAAGFAEKLRGSYWARNLGYDTLAAEFERIDPSLRARPEVAELGTLIKRARELDQRGDRFEPELPIAKMDFDRIPVLK
ncbi:MAG: VWA domain-containing protein [Polyangiaceae bacterium]|nr:VWA domain-containing protein [Polyangiaceae bacterium]